MSDAAPRRIGRYELSTKIASGGMATVYFGRSVGAEGFSRIVAIKRMHPHMVEDAGFRAMFIDEGRLAAQIHHPNVAQIIDLVAEGNELLLVMTYIHGATVSTLLQGHQGPLPPSVAVRIAVDALLGLHAAHTAKGPAGAPLGIVHRDVSPQNLLVSAEGSAVVVDFGVAKAIERLQTSRHGELKGKIRYMAPEQIRMGQVGPWTDVYAVGVVLWEMLTGRRLFTASNDAALMAQVLEGPQARPASFVPTLPPSLDDVVMNALSRDLTARYPSALAMATTLEGLGIAASAREVADVVATRARPTLEEREETLSKVRSQQLFDDDALVTKARTLSGVAPVSTAHVEEPHAVAAALPQRARRTFLVGLALGGAGIVVSLLWLQRGVPAPPPSPNEAVTVGASSPPPATATSVAPISTGDALSPAAALPVPVPVSATLPRTLAPRRPLRPQKPPVDCAENPRVLGPDGVYQVRRECLGR